MRSCCCCCCSSTSSSSLVVSILESNRNHGSKLWEYPKAKRGANVAIRSTGWDSRRNKWRVCSMSTDPGQTVELSWQIAVGSIAGVTPFVVAGIEFGKRINAQRNCKTCKGSGLVLKDNKYYFRCPSCGGFLPWQSWTRFFTG